MNGLRLSVMLGRFDGALYAQRRAGRKMHHVDAYTNGTVGGRAACGVLADGQWRMTCNLPLGQFCGNCRRLRGRHFSMSA